MESKTQTIDFEKSIGSWLRKTTKILDYHLYEAFQEANLNLTKEQMFVLKKLNNQNGLNQNELAELTYRDKSSLARLLSKMEKKRYVERRQHPDDKRVNEIFMTPTGRAVFARSRPVIKKLMDTMESNITKDEKKLVIKVMKKVEHNFNVESALK